MGPRVNGRRAFVAEFRRTIRAHAGLPLIRGRPLACGAALVLMGVVILVVDPAGHPRGSNMKEAAAHATATAAGPAPAKSTLARDARSPATRTKSPGHSPAHSPTPAPPPPAAPSPASPPAPLQAKRPPRHVPITPSPAATFAGTADLALHRPVTATSYIQAYHPANVTDGDTGSYWESRWAFPQSMTVDLGSATGISKIVLMLPPLPDWNSRVQTLTIYGSRASAAPAFTIAGPARYTFDAARGNTATIRFTPKTARYVTLYFTANNGWPAAQLSEIRIYA